MITDVPDDAPQGPTVIYAGDPKKVTEMADYCRKHKIQSMTGVTDLVGQGVTLIVGIQNKKPKILVDTENAKKEGIEFDPAIFKLATSF